MNLRELRRRVLRRVQKSAGCWNWTGAATVGGYGTYRTMGLATTAHRVAYIAWFGAIPEGAELDHLCRNTRCVNPAHLEPVTHLENVRRSAKAQQTHCVNGHAFIPQNTRIKGNGCRACKACAAAHQRRLRRRRAAQKEGSMTKLIKNQAAQGDLLFRRVKEIPSTAVDVTPEHGDVIAGHSETGHHHVARGPGKIRMFEDPANPLVCYLRAETAEFMDMVHLRSFDTHGTIRLDASDDKCWEVRRQREHTPEGWRRVAD